MIINIGQAMSLNMKTVFLGDFNLNAFTSKDVTDIEQLLQLTQLVQEATRVTPTSSTLIDLIFTNMPDMHTATGVVNLSISDHYLTYTSVSFKCPKAPPSIIRCRNLNSLNVDRFRYDILCSDINNICNIENASRAWDEWKRIFSLICNKHAPLRDIRVKTRCSPWISKEIILLINQREHLHCKQLKT